MVLAKRYGINIYKKVLWVCVLCTFFFAFYLKAQADEPVYIGGKIPISESDDSEEEEKPSIPVIGQSNKENQQSDEQEQEEEKNKPPFWVFVVAPCALLVLSAGAVVIILKVKSGKGEKPTKTTKKTGRKKKDDPPIQETYIQPVLPKVPRRGTFMYLKAVTPGFKDYKIEFNDSVIIGRAEGNIIIDADKTVSSVHCEFRKKGELYYLRDLGSSNGTYYNGKMVYKEIPILPEGRVRIGKCEYELLIKEEWVN